MLDGGYELDIEIVNGNIAGAEVVTLYFPLLGKTLLVDTRVDEQLGGAAERPLVRLVPMAKSSADRFDSLRRLRPQLPRPESITMIPWHRRVDSLTGAGVWARLLDRLDTPDGSSRQEADRCLDRLRALEREEVRSAITGLHYSTLWGLAGVGDEG